MGPRPRLSTRERQIAAAIKLGCSNREIAERLNLREQTVKNYLSCILEKFGVANRTQLAIALNKRRWWPNDDSARRTRPSAPGRIR
jgi:DNA-binding NarL/FixJ family response regulator